MIEVSLARPEEVQAIEVLPREGGEGGFEGSGPLIVGEGPTNPKKLTFELGPVAFQFAHAIAHGTARELCCFGARGDRKTSAAFIGMLWHACLHAAEGHPLPVMWMSVRDTHTSHRLTTVRTLQHGWWGGIWRIEQDQHVAIARVNGQDLIHVDLLGVEDRGAIDRLRMEVVGVHFDEVAPVSVLLSSSGISSEAWAIALTSQRLASHCHPAAITTNLPDEDHWSWQDFVAQPRPGTACFRIPPGESASAAQREEWARALEGRPDLLRRLLTGEPGGIALGPQVAESFKSDLHVAKERLHPIPGEPLFLGQDFGHTPATIIGQPWRGAIRIYAALPCERGGVRQHYDGSVIPWLTTHAPWALRGENTLLRGCYDPAGQTGEQTDIEANPIGTIERMIGGIWEPGPVKWEARKHCLLSALNRHAAPGVPAVQIDPVDGRPLIQALAGRWYYPQDRLGNVSRDLPKKPNHPHEDLGDAFIYLLSIMLIERPLVAVPIQVESEFSLSGFSGRGPRW